MIYAHIEICWKQDVDWNKVHVNKTDWTTTMYPSYISAVTVLANDLYIPVSEYLFYKQ